MTESSATLDLLLKLIPLLVVAFSGLGGFLYWLLKRTLDARFAERLAQTTHQLKLEQDKMSVIYLNQKDSFRNVLVGMHNSIEAIERRIAGEGDWRPIDQKDVDSFSRIRSQESLFMDDASDHAVRLFRDVMQTAVQFESQIPTGDEVWRAYNQMNFIAECMAQRFRIRVVSNRLYLTQFWTSNCWEPAT